MINIFSRICSCQSNQNTFPCRIKRITFTFIFIASKISSICIYYKFTVNLYRNKSMSDTVCFNINTREKSIRIN